MSKVRNLSSRENAKRRSANTQIIVLTENIASLNEKMDEHMIQTSALILRFNDHILEYTKYKGFIGGMTFVFSALWIFFAFVFGNFKSAIGKFFGSIT